MTRLSHSKEDRLPGKGVFVRDVPDLCFPEKAVGGSVLALRCLLLLALIYAFSIPTVLILSFRRKNGARIISDAQGCESR
jgi:hypothetical protein